MNSNDEYIKIDSDMDVTWESIGKILCEYTAPTIAKRSAEIRENLAHHCDNKQGTPQ